MSRRLLVLLVALAAVAVALVLVAALGHRPLAYVTRDPQATTFERWFLGFFSNVGSALWWAGAGIALLAACVLLAAPARRAPDETGWFLLAVAGLTAVLGIDDMFGVHDVWGHEHGVAEWPFFAVYGALAAVTIWRFRRAVARTWLTPLVGAVVLYVFSTLVDWMSGHSTSDVRYLGEDGVKLLGIVCWVAWVGHSAFRALSLADGAPSPLPYD
jgi:hypothetical protein